MSDFNSASGAVRQELPPIACHSCHEPLRANWVYVSARSIAGRLYALDLCGVCWVMLKQAIEWEVAAGAPLPAHWARSPLGLPPGEDPRGERPP